MFTLGDVLMATSLPKTGLICLLEDRIDEDWRVGDRKEWEADELRNTDIGIVLREAALIPQMTVSQNIEIALRIQKWEGRSREDIRDRVERVLTFVGLEHCEKVKASKLTARECRLVAFARALVKDPRILVLEPPKPSAKLNDLEEVLPLLCQIAKTRLVVIVTDPASAPEQADENSIFDLVARVQAGKIVKVQEKVVKQKPNSAQRRAEEMKAVREVEKIIPGRSDVHAKRLSVIDRIRMSRHFARRNRAGRRGLIFLLLLMFLAAIVTLTVKSFDGQPLIVKYLNKYQPRFLTGEIVTGYFEDGIEWEDSIKSGPYYLDRIREVAVQTGKEAIPVITEQWLFTDESDPARSGYYGATFAVLEENDPALFSIAEGSFPEQKNEILISDYLAQELQVSLGDPITSSMGEYHICGIYSTDFNERDDHTRSKFESGTSAEQMERKYNYAMVVIDREALTASVKQAGWLKLRGAEFLESLYGYTMIAGLETISEEDLVYGRMPRERNEVLISYKMYQYNIDLFEAGSIEKQFEFADIHAKRYNGYYSERLNLADFFPEGVTIVGVCSDRAVGYDVEYDSSIISYRVSNEVFEEIRDAYLSDYIFDGYLLNCSDVTDYKELAQTATDQGYRFDVSFLDDLYYLKDLKEPVLTYCWWILAPLSVIAFLCMIAYARASVSGNQSEIRMLRALGVYGKDIVSAFTFRSFMIAVRAAAYSALIALAAIWTLNFMIRESVVGGYVDILDWQPDILWMLLTGVFVLTVTGHVVAKWKMRHMTPVEIIRRNEK